MADLINAFERFESRFDNKIKNDKIYPNWAFVVFITVMLFGVCTLFFAIR
ncbi:hypothetical protein [Flavivirga sp. 57AJ16]|nr:hypothetical protein [Flavivirga sp. 57AJ16]MDD7885492.1 hypothetical protein [Flavivirga sp. 57AJ16]